MAEPLLLGIDLGAGSLKSSVVDALGQVRASASAPVSTLSPRPGFSEQDPAEWWAATKTTLSQLWRDGIDPHSIVGVAFTAGAHTQVLEDEDRRVLRPAIMWNDQRSGRQVERLRQTYGDEILQLSGNRVSPTWTLPQLLWVYENEPDLHRQIARVYAAKDWLRSRLDGSWACDLTDAWGMMLADTETSDWSARLTGLAHLDRGVLAPIVSSTAITGTVTAVAAADTGLRAGTPVICGTSDTNAETFSAGMTRPGTGAIKLATAGTVSTLTPKPAFADDIIHYPHLVPGHHYAILGTNSCASAHRWLRDTLGPQHDFAGLDVLAGSVAAGSNGLLFHPYLNGERSPYWDPDLRASFVGLGFEHGPGHMTRALYEGIAYSLRDCLEVLRSRGLGFEVARLVGGGTRSRTWTQIIADITGVAIEVPGEGDASFGAALLAGLGTGVFADVDAAASVIRVAGHYEPQALHRDVYEEGFSLYRDTKVALTDIHHRLVAAQRERA